jgi:aldose 1-epimerase
MEPISLYDPTTGSTARIAAHLGFNCYEFHARLGGVLVDVIDSEPGFIDGDKRPSGNGIPILFPYPNRIRGGHYTWKSRDYHIDPAAAAFDPLGNAIHGFCLDRPWRVTNRDEQFVVGEFVLSTDAPDRLPFWPADFGIEVRYELRGPALRADIRVWNPSDTPLPWGLGTHPYFRVPLSPNSDPSHCLIIAPAAQAWELAEFLPTGKQTAIDPSRDLRDGAYFGEIQWDDVLTDLEHSGDSVECVIMDESAGLQISQLCDAGFRELVVYTPPGRNSVCLEPYTCVTDAINLQQRGVDAGLRVLEPGGEFRIWFEIRAGLVIA